MEKYTWIFKNIEYNIHVVKMTKKLFTFYLLYIGYTYVIIPIYFKFQITEK